MTDKAISPLRQRLIEDMTIRRLGPKTQHDYSRRVKSFADFVGRSADKATAEDVHRYQLRLASIGTTVPTVNATASALRFFFRVTLKRRDLADAVVSVREPRRLPVVLSPQEVGRLLASTTNIKHRAALSLTYATGLRASEVILGKRSPPVGPGADGVTGRTVPCRGRAVAGVPGRPFRRFSYWAGRGDRSAA
jgi:integrase/recombinase XerD